MNSGGDDVLELTFTEEGKQWAAAQAGFDSFEAMTAWRDANPELWAEFHEAILDQLKQHADTDMPLNEGDVAYLVGFSVGWRHGAAQREIAP